MGLKGGAGGSRGRSEEGSDINEEIEVDDGGANGCEKRRGWNGNGLN